MPEKDIFVGKWAPGRREAVEGVAYSTEVSPAPNSRVSLENSEKEVAFRWRQSRCQWHEKLSESPAGQCKNEDGLWSMAKVLHHQQSDLDREIQKERR